MSSGAPLSNRRRSLFNEEVPERENTNWAPKVTNEEYESLKAECEKYRALIAQIRQKDSITSTTSIRKPTILPERKESNFDLGEYVEKVTEFINKHKQMKELKTKKLY